MKTIIGIALAVLLLPLPALADSGNKYGGENRGKPVMPAAVNKLWAQECGSCHIAYPPGLLPAASWTRIMGGLDKHFGDDAALTPAENKEITAFLVNNPSNRWSAPTAPLRISESQWFKAKHNSREIAPEVWQRPAVKSPANCGACHGGAAEGDFNEHRIRIPR